MGQHMDVSSHLRCDNAERYSVFDLSVYDVQGHRGTEPLRTNDHLLVLMNSGGRLKVFWEGYRKLCDQVSSGDLIFSPAGSELSCEHEEAVDSAFIRLKQSTFSKAALGHVDHDRIDLTGRHIRDKSASSLASAVATVGFAAASLAWPMLIESATMSLAVAVIAAMSPGASTAFMAKPYGLSDFRFKRLEEYIDANLHRHISLAEMADLCTVSQYHFTRLFKKRTGITVMQYIGMRRIERSKRMMQNTGLTLAQIAHDCGFSSQSHFTGVFRLDTGTTPAAYRRAIT